jgi:hypothetical protein
MDADILDIVLFSKQPIKHSALSLKACVLMKRANPVCLVQINVKSNHSMMHAII